MKAPLRISRINKYVKREADKTSINHVEIILSFILFKGNFIAIMTHAISKAKIRRKANNMGVFLSTQIFIIDLYSIP